MTASRIPDGLISPNSDPSTVERERNPIRPLLTRGESSVAAAPPLPMRLTIEGLERSPVYHGTVGASPIIIVLFHKFERERDTLPAADAQRDDALA